MEYEKFTDISSHKFKGNNEPKLFPLYFSDLYFEIKKKRVDPDLS